MFVSVRVTSDIIHRIRKMLQEIFILDGRWLYTGPRDDARDFLALQVMRSFAGFWGLSV